MKRSAGVTFAAIVALTGSGGSVVIGLLSSLVMLLVNLPLPQGQVAPPRAFLVAVNLGLYVLPGIVGIITGIGLFRLKNWARLSTLIFASLLVMTGALVAVAVPFLPLAPPPTPDSPIDPARIALVARFFMLSIAAFMLSVGAWWLILFTRPTVNAQFAGTAPSPVSSGRPISIMIIAVLMLLGALGIVFSAAMRTPAPLLFVTLTGAAATVYYVAVFSVLLLGGIGLFRLDNRARLLAIGYCVLTLANALFFTLVPGAGERLRALIDTQMQRMTWVPQPNGAMPFQMMTMARLGMIVSAAMTVVALYFLVTRRAAFEKPGPTLARPPLGLDAIPRPPADTPVE